MLLTTLVGFLAVAIFGQVAGEEFSPDLVERRSFSYLELPLLKIQLTPIDHVSTTGDLEQFLVSRKFVTIPPSAKNSPRWHLVRMRTGRERLGDAQILCEYLDHCVVGKSPYWKHWSLDHAPLAQKLWPAVFSAARQELYSFIPDLFATTNGVTDPDVLQRLLDRTFATRFAELAEWHQTHGDDATAIEIFTAGLKHAPDDPRLLRGRAASNDRLRKK